MRMKTRTDKAGSAVAAIDAAISDGGEIRTRVHVQRPRRKDLIAVWMSLDKQSTWLRADGKSTRAFLLPINIGGRGRTATSLLRDLAAQLRPAKVDLGRSEARGTGCAEDDATLAWKVVAAWCELLGHDVPTPAELQKSREQHRRYVDEVFKQFVHDVRCRPAAPQSNTLSAAHAAECQPWRQRVQALRNLAPMDAHPSLAGADLRGANLTALSLYQFNMSRCLLRGADMRGDWGLADFSGADLRKTRFSRASLAHVKFIDADLSSSALDEADLLGARFVRASLKKANLRVASFDRASFDDVVWDGAEFDERTRWPVGFLIPANLVWVGEGDDPRASQPAKPRKRRSPQRLTADLLLSDEQLASRIAGMERDPKLPADTIDAADDSALARETKFAILFEYLPHRLADLGLTQKEIDLNAWYRYERLARLQDAAQGSYNPGYHQWADRWLENIFGTIEPIDFQAIWNRIDREIQEMTTG